MMITPLLLANLADLELHELKRIIDTNYYTQAIACDGAKGMNDAIDNVISDLLVIEEASASIDRFDISKLCVTYRHQMAQQLTLSLLIN